MTTRTRLLLLHADALYLLVAASSGLLNDILGIFFARGPVDTIIALAPQAAIGFVEAHGLAFIIGVLLWNAAPERDGT